MKTAPIALTLLLASTPALFAQDADEDGLVTFDELVAAYPDVTEDTFNAADANGDGTLDADELAAAREAGLIPMDDM
ncbi:hypothetical protein [Sinisalibacter aestuarii]|uniref:EF-hand domain-containing protein n=1 Tax=Sinisalibacter aestuarii TaxID=2949426 RepID=A0ABQ5LP87_9RHOB|nr:hypothetical protein [Sinisalibacter aestuarii]GKY86820.1 hypothetical protein STA1M1_06890 [Sinisalibacter aestuarii]